MFVNENVSGNFFGKMNKPGWLIVLFLSWGVCEGQNLVPNPSFEDSLQCPYGISQINFANGWSSYRESADYFHSCASPNGMGVPVNARGSQFAFGEAYAGIMCFHFTVSNIREYMGIQLLQSLIPGQKYFVSFYVSLADTLGMNCPSSKIGAKFSSVAFSFSSPAPITNSAHVYTDSIISDKINWTPITGSFIADSAYVYLMIGNFFDDANTDTANCAWYSCFYVDMICVSTDSVTCNPSVGINEVSNEDELILFPNPFMEKLTITTKRNELVDVTLFDVTSRKIFNQSFTNSISINTSQLAKGIYIYEVRNNPDSYRDGVIKKGKLIKNP